MMQTHGGKEATAEAATKLGAEFFYNPAHRTIFQVIVDLHDANIATDFITVTQALRDRKLLDSVGGAAAVTNLGTFIPTAAAVSHYIEIVRDKYIRRQGIAAYTEAVRRLYDEQDDNLSALDVAESKVASLRSLHGRNGAISLRSPKEILAMPRNSAANFFGDRLLGLALSLVMAGIGGIGKSRLLLQLLVAFIIERAWCGIETHNTRGKPWVLVQTQNAISRLQDDLEPLKKYAGDDWPLVEKNLIIHTLETDRDSMLHLSDLTNINDLENAIREFNPIGVAFDPLNDVAVGDLSKDVDMMATCHAIGRVSRVGNPERAIIIATHALTGVAGMKKAFGFEAPGFGRNSKVLMTWSRAFVNVVPAREDYSTLILTCGKNNNGKMFDPFAVRLNSQTMIYEPDPDFDIQGFRQHIESPTKTKQAYSPQIVADMDWPKRELDKPQLAKAIEAETGCSRSTSYRLVDLAVIQHIIRYSKLTRIYAKK